MRAPGLLVLAAVTFDGTLARADGALEEVSAGNVPQTSTSGQSTWLADKIAGMWEPSEAWQVRLDVTGTRTKTTLAESDVLLATAAIEYDPNEHWMLRVLGGGSPASTSLSTTTVQLNTAMPIDADAQLQSRSSSISGAAWVGYDTAGDSNFETTAFVSANVTRFDSLQQITSVTGRNGQMLTVPQLQTYCAKHACGSQLKAVLDPQSTKLDQITIDATLSEQLWKGTDLGLDAAYYLYDKDPTTVGYFSAVGAGRSATGAGIGIAPLQYTIAPSLIHRFGPVTALSSLSYGHYVDQEGYDVTASVRVQYKLKLGGDRRLKLWTKATGSHDRDQANALSKSGSLALGVQFAW